MKGPLMMLFMLLQTLLFCSCSDKIEPGEEKIDRPVVSGVEIAEVQLTEVSDFYETSATLKAQTTSKVAARIMGQVTAIYVREGEQVTAGQVLADLDAGDINQKIAAAVAALTEAENGLAAAQKQQELASITFERYKKLFEGRALTRQELDQTQTSRDVATFEVERMRGMVKRSQATLAEARVYQEFTSISSPVSGVVTSKETELGSMAVPGMPLFTIEDNSSYTLDMWVSENMLDRIDGQNPVELVIPATNTNLDGKILEIVPSVDPKSRTFLVKIAVNGQGLQSGRHVKARIEVGKRSAIFLPESCIVHKGQLSGVYVVNEKNILAYRLVRLGKQYNGLQEILTGLVAGEKFIKTGVDRAKDGGLLAEEKRS